jgi:serine/threonine protein kinase, bacterial
MHIGSVVLSGVILVGSVAACSPVEQGAGDEHAAGRATTTAVVPATPQIAANSKEALESAAHQLDLLASQRNASAAYEFYSQRCKNIIGDVDSYRTFLAAWLDGRSPQYSGVTVKVNGSSGQVVSIDDDRNAPASSMNPRTWTFIDGRWQFDNC